MANIVNVVKMVNIVNVVNVVNVANKVNMQCIRMYSPDKSGCFQSQQRQEYFESRTGPSIPSRLTCSSLAISCSPGIPQLVGQLSVQH